MYFVFVSLSVYDSRVGEHVSILSHAIAIKLNICWRFVVSCQSPNRDNIDAAKKVNVVAGSQAVLPCKTNNNATVLWAFYDSSQPRPFLDIYVAGNTINGYATRFSVSDSVEYQQDLVIANVSRTDEGLYVCVEDEGFGPIHYLMLVIRG